jgi:nucleoside-diphosphate-sugar epimerase
VKILVAGATGAIGRPLIAQLVAEGHDVVGLTRVESRAAELRARGAEAIVCDVLEQDAARNAVLAVKPDVVVDQLTSLPRDYNVRKMAKFYAANDRVRRIGTAALVEAAKEAGVRRYVVQSIAFLYAPDGGGAKSETARPWTDAPEPFAESVRVLVRNEQMVTEATEFAGLALRFGMLYGPGTYYASDGSIASQVRKRQFPVVGNGGGVTSYLHVSDAAAAIVRAIDHGAPGVYNIVDDDPTPVTEWLPIYARAIGAKPPRHVPPWMARILSNRFIVEVATRGCGATNAKAKTDLGWQPAIPSWRDGFASYLDTDPPPAPASS